MKPKRLLSLYQKSVPKVHIKRLCLFKRLKFLIHLDFLLQSMNFKGLVQWTFSGGTEIFLSVIKNIFICVSKMNKSLKSLMKMTSFSRIWK